MLRFFVFLTLRGSGTGRVYPNFRVSLLLFEQNAAQCNETAKEYGGRACRNVSEGGIAPPHGAFLFIQANKKEAKNGL